MSQPLDILDTSIEYIKGIGPGRAELLKTELSIFTFRDLLMTFPFRYEDRSIVTAIRDLKDDGEYVQVRGKLGPLQFTGPNYQKRINSTLTDDSGWINLVWFQGASWLQKSLQPGSEYILYGKISLNGFRATMAHPEMELISIDSKGKKGFYPVYNSSEKLASKGIDSKARKKYIESLFEKISFNHLPENLPLYLIDKIKLCTRYESLRWIHLPEDRSQIEAATRRLKFEELFFLQLRYLTSKSHQRKHSHGPEFKTVGEKFNTFFHHHLKFQLTEAQKKVIKEIRQDTGSGAQMNRLLQGDVGAGKTIVAIMIMLLAIDNGYQACIMAPTEILAQQHFASTTNALAEMGIRIGLLTGSIKGKKRQELLNQLIRGDIDILIGTHALLEDPVQFKNLGIAVIDEQHRFGVAQRANLWQKNQAVVPHILVMTATPIPRTLYMVCYGDLDISMIDQLPPGRKPIKTMHFFERSRPQLIQFMKDQIQLGRQIYVVYPLIEESEKLDLQDLNNGFEMLLQFFPQPEYQMSVLHGRMKSDVKEQEMQRFIAGKTQILVSTTVIEVGVDVPNASVMIIENAERFGLSQMHQLRGRVGRGVDQSYCILMTGFKLSKDSKIRIKTMCDTTDGFKIAEVDLELRGPGDIDGTRQSGGIDLQMVNLSTDTPLIESVRKIVEKILERDPQLKHPDNRLLLDYLKEVHKNETGWSMIS